MFGSNSDPRFAALELLQHVHDFVIERIFALAVVGAFTQHERFDHAAQRIGRQLTVRNDDRSGELVAQAQLLRMRRTGQQHIAHIDLAGGDSMYHSS